MTAFAIGAHFAVGETEMLTITPDQWIALAQSQKPLTTEAVARRLQADFPEPSQTLGPNALLALAASSLEIADRYGLWAHNDRYAYASLRLVVGPDFDLHPRAQRILSQPNTPPDQRMSLLLERMRRGQWLEAAEGRP